MDSWNEMNIKFDIDNKILNKIVIHLDMFDWSVEY